jgi:hypothetical protein
MEESGNGYMNESSVKSTNNSSGDIIFVTLWDEKVLKGIVTEFNPDLDRFDLFMSQSSVQNVVQTILFESVKMIAFLKKQNNSQGETNFTLRAQLINIRFNDGAMMHGVIESFAGDRKGLFFVPISTREIERIFVPISSIRDMVSVQRLGEILIQEKILTNAIIEQAIKKQMDLRRQHLGEILLENHVINNDQLKKGLEIQRLHGEKKLGEILLEQGFINLEQLEEGLERQVCQRNKKLGEVLVECGFATHKMIGIALSIQYNVPFINIANQHVDQKLKEIITFEMATKFQIMPLELNQRNLTIAIMNPAEHFAQDFIGYKTGYTIIVAVSTPDDISRAIKKYYQRDPIPQQQFALGQ